MKRYLLPLLLLLVIGSTVQAQLVFVDNTMVGYGPTAEAA